MPGIFFFFWFYSAQFKSPFIYEIQYDAVDSTYCLNSNFTLTGAENTQSEICAILIYKTY